MKPSQESPSSFQYFELCSTLSSCPLYHLLPVTKPNIMSLQAVSTPFGTMVPCVYLQICAWLGHLGHQLSTGLIPEITSFFFYMQECIRTVYKGVSQHIMPTKLTLMFRFKSGCLFQCKSVLYRPPIMLSQHSKISAVEHLVWNYTIKLEGWLTTYHCSLPPVVLPSPLNKRSRGWD